MMRNKSAEISQRWWTSAMVWWLAKMIPWDRSQCINVWPFFATFMLTLSKFKKDSQNQNEQTCWHYTCTCIFLSDPCSLCYFTCFRYSWSDSISTSHCNTCFTNGANIPRPALSLSLNSFRHSMAVWRIPGYGLVKVNSRFIMTTKHHHVYCTYIC